MQTQFFIPNKYQPLKTQFKTHTESSTYMCNTTIPKTLHLYDFYKNQQKNQCQEYQFINQFCRLRSIIQEMGIGNIQQGDFSSLSSKYMFKKIAAKLRIEVTRLKSLKGTNKRISYCMWRTTHPLSASLDKTQLVS